MYVLIVGGLGERHLPCWRWCCCPQTGNVGLRWCLSLSLSWPIGISVQHDPMDVARSPHFGLTYSLKDLRQLDPDQYSLSPSEQYFLAIVTKCVMALGSPKVRNQL